MPWYQYVSWFFGGAFLVNAVPHFVGGVMGQSFQSPFAKPPGEGLSSSTVNVLWGAFNIAVGYVLICEVGDFDLRSPVSSRRCRPGCSAYGRNGGSYVRTLPRGQFFGQMIAESLIAR
jgi:hypothetical protein